MLPFCAKRWGNKFAYVGEQLCFLHLAHTRHAHKISLVLKGTLSLKINCVITATFQSLWERICLVMEH